MVTEPLVIEFDEHQRAPVVKRMVTMAGNRQGWVNLTPGLDVDVPPPPRSVLANLLGARGPDVPLGTWAAQAKGDREPSTVGIHHGRGPKAAQRLAAEGLTVPETWRLLQDHPKRGFVCAVPATTDETELDALLDWLLRATGFLCPVPRTGEWRALCYRAI
ncbi:MAG: hypothetical protein ACRD2C_22825 [Acidimicrobiales bacterium]